MKKKIFTLRGYGDMKTTTIKTKAMSILLAIVMLLGMLPMSAFAATTENNIITLTPDDLVEGASGEGWVFSNNQLTIQPEYTLVFEGECPVYVVNNGNIENGIFNGEVFSEGTISGGTFSSQVTNAGTITGGTFSGTVANNTVYAVISNGIFNGEAHNFGTISGGTFSGKLVNYWDRSISGITIELSNALIEGGESYGWSLDEYNNLSLNSGITFYWKAGETCGYPVDNEGTITGGIFNGEVHNSGTISGGTFNSSWGTNFGTITGGTFSGGVIKNESSGTITGGTFNGEVHNSGGDISGGTFSGKLRKNSGSISGITIELSNALIQGGESYGWSLDDNNLSLNSGITFYWKAGEECAYHAQNSGTISGGTFSGWGTNYGTISGGTFSLIVNNYGTITDGTFSGNVSNGGTISGGKFTGSLGSSGIVTGAADLSECATLDIRHGPRFGKDVKLPKAVMEGNLTYTGCDASTQIALEYYADGDCTSTHTVSGSNYSFAVEGYKRTDPEADLSTLEEITHEVKAASMDGYEITVTKANWDRFNITVAHTTPELIITGGTAGTDYTYENGVLDIKAAGTYEIKNANPAAATSDIIKVSAPSGTVNITLGGVNIDVSNTGNATVGTYGLCAFEITANCTTNITLKDETANILKSGVHKAGLQNKTYPLIISCEHREETNHQCGPDCGALEAVGSWAAGIGGQDGFLVDCTDGSNITIHGGNITAKASYNGAGIGGGDCKNGDNILITGGVITATGERGAGIGGGDEGNGSNITISGGTVIVTSAEGAGIGGGDEGNGSNITISGGTVTATSTDGAGIGGSNEGNGSNITISGGVVTATSTHGGGIGGIAENIKIAPAANTRIYAYNGSDDTGTALVGSPFTAETDITRFLNGNAFYSYAEHVHDWGNWLPNNNGTHTRTCAIDASHIETKNCSGGTATCTEKAGCQVCAQPYGDTLPHTYGTEWKSDGTNHWHECTCGAKTEEAAHSGGTATCKDKAACSVCSQPYGETLGHDWGNWISNSDGTHTRTCANDANHTETENCSGGIATCTEKAVCTVCAVAYGDTVPHTFGTEWKSDGTNHWHECTCGAKSEEATHSGGTATCKDKAVCSVCTANYGELANHTYKDGKCTVCEAADPNYVPETDSPQTGDNSNMALWLALLFISGGAIITLTVYDRKRRTANH